MNALELPSLASQAPSFTQIDDDDDEGNEEEQMILIMNQIRAHQKKTEKRKLQKNFEAKSKEACARFKKICSQDLASQKKRRRATHEDLKGRLDRIGNDQVAADQEFKAASEEHQAAFDSLLGAMEKSLGKLVDLKAKSAALQGSFADESELGREVITQWVADAVDGMSDKIQNIEESESNKKSGLMAQMLQMIGAS